MLFLGDDLLVRPKLAIIHRVEIFKNSSLPPLQSNFFVEHGGRGDSSSLPEPFIKLTCSHSRGTINPLTSYPPPAETWRDFILAGPRNAKLKALHKPKKGLGKNPGWCTKHGTRSGLSRCGKNDD